MTVDTNPTAMPETAQATAMISPSDAAQTVTWSSSDPSRATVDASGVITPLLQGSVTITATSTADVTKSGSVVLNIVCSDPRPVDANVQGDTRWENWIPDPSCFDYVVRTFLSLDNETLTIEPGTVVGFTSNSRLRMVNDGVIKAIGTAEEPIWLKGTEEQPGHWAGVVFQNARLDENTLDYVTIEHGGSGPNGTFLGANLEVLGDSRVSITNTVLRHSLGFGIYVQEAATLTAFESNQMTSNTAQGAYVSARIVGALGAGNDFSDNGINQIRVETGTNNHLLESATWLDHGLPYFLAFLNGRQWNITNATLTLDPGVTLLMSDDLGIKVDPGSHVEAVGTTERPITFDASDSGWQGLNFIDATGTFEETSITNAGSISGGSERAAITVLTLSPDPPASRVTFGNNVTVSGTDYEIAFGLGDTFAPCVGRVFIPSPDTSADHCI
ncbi:MAG: hypothetical protein Rubg2KO_20370 [Rubricoccaceae bacterium]